MRVLQAPASGGDLRHSSIDKVPVIYATEEDVLGSFASFIERRVDANTAVWRCGMCKVVLPPGYHIGGSAEKAREKVLSKGEFKIRNPIRQHITGRGGLYRSLAVAENSISASEFSMNSSSGPSLRGISQVSDERGRHAAPKDTQEHENGTCKIDEEYEARARVMMEDECISRQFWRSLSSLSPPLYGADIMGTLCDVSCNNLYSSLTKKKTRPGMNKSSLFPLDSDEDEDDSDDDQWDKQEEEENKELYPSNNESDHKVMNSSWQIGKLDTLLTKTIKDSLPGVTTPYLYLGSWRSFFAWHTEDQDLYSINFLHFGARKTWYCIPPAKRERFERCMKDALPDLFQSCSEFLRHKEILCSPTWLQQHDIPYMTCSQSEGEIMINMPGALHAGFNHGFNCAESVNFGTERWLPIGRRARSCTCARDSVRINMSLFSCHPEDESEGSEDQRENQDENGNDVNSSVAFHQKQEVREQKVGEKRLVIKSFDKDHKRPKMVIRVKGAAVPSSI